jgi:type II secretion system protein I
MAVVSTLDSYVVNADYLRQKTLESWIATNKITELSVASTWPEIGDYEEEVEFAGQKWRCEIVVSATDVDNLRRVDVSVTLLGDTKKIVHKVSGLLEPPAPPGFVSPQWSMPGPGNAGGGERG